MVSGQNHVGDLLGDVAHPLLPQIPVGLVDDAHVTTLGTTLVGDLALGKRLLVLGGDDTTRQLRAGAVVADGPGVLAGHDTGGPVISVTDVTAVPGEGGFAGGLGQVLVSTLGVGVAHVVENSHGELGGVTGLAGSGEAQNLGLGCAIGGGDLVVVGLTRLEVGERDLVEELTALGDGLDLRAGRGTVVAGAC